MLSTWIRQGKAAVAVVVNTLRGFPPQDLAPVICSVSDMALLRSTSATASSSALPDFRILWGVPKFRTPKPRIMKRKFAYTRTFKFADDLTTCKSCGFSHHISTICGSCYESIREVTNSIKSKMMMYNPYLGERQDKSIVVKYEGDPEPKVTEKQRIIEVPHERVSWFKKKLD